MKLIFQALTMFPSIVSILIVMEVENEAIHIKARAVKVVGFNPYCYGSRK